MSARRKIKKPAATTSLPKSKINFLPWLNYILLSAGMVSYIGLVISYNFTQDDAYITFRYAENFVNGHGLVYNIGEHIEGYTNFLWLLLAILGRLIGLDYVVFSKILGAICGAGGIYVTFQMGQISWGRRSALAGLAALLLGSVYSYAYWAGAGLETAAFALAVTASFYFYLKRSLLSGVAVLWASLLRPEGALVFLFLIGFDLLSERRVTKFVLFFAGLYLVPLIPYAVFKWSYFGGVIPNPFYAKTDFSMGQLENGLEYAWQFIQHYPFWGLFFIPTLVVLKKLNRDQIMLFSFLVIYTLYVILIGGDVLKVHRFFVAVFPLIVLHVVYCIIRITSWQYLIWPIAVVILVVHIYLPQAHVQTYHQNEIGLNKKLNEIVDQLLETDKSEFSIAISTIGIVGYRLMGHTVIDLLGLTDSTVARHPESPIEGLKTTWKETKYNSQYILARQPDYIMFSTGVKPSAPAERALFTYRAFLNSYRTIGFYYAGYIHEVYKRYYPVVMPVERNVASEFVQNYVDGINLWNQDRLKESELALNKALRAISDPPYPYVFYYLADVKRKANDLKASYLLLQTVNRLDTLNFLAQRDLYIIEKALLRNMDRAGIHRAALEKLVPWYLPRIDSMTVQTKKVVDSHRLESDGKAPQPE